MLRALLGLVLLFTPGFMAVYRSGLGPDGQRRASLRFKLPVAPEGER